jgi:hypothetical protein
MAQDNITSILLAMALLLLPLATWAQANDSAYCAELAELVLRYAGSPDGNGGNRPDFTTIEAIQNCNKDNTAAGIKVPEQKLRSNGITMPRRIVPA